MNSTSNSIAPYNLFLSLLVLLSCRGQTLPPLVDTLGSPVDQTGYLWKPDMRKYAPIIMEASVLEDNVVQRNRVAARFPDVLLNLHRAKCHAEIIVRGTVDNNNFDFYYFTQSPESPTGNPKYKRLLRIEPGNRYILFLANERGVLRTVGDVGEYAIQVIGELQASYGPPPYDLGRAVADILLHGADSSNADAFSRHIESGAELVNQWGASRLYTIHLLRNLLSEPEPIRQAACQTLVDLYSGQFACLRSIRDDPQSPQNTRDWAAKTTKLAEEWEALLIRDLKDPAHLGFLKARLPHPENQRDIFEELESLVDSPNQAIRDGACNALKRYYPFASSNCAAR